MKKAIVLIGISACAVIPALAQSLAEVERLQRRASAIASCEEMSKRGATDDSCREFHFSKPAIAQTERTAGEVGGKPMTGIGSADAIEVVSYSAAEVRGKYDQVINVLLDNQSYFMRVGDSAMGWKLTRLTDYEAEFQPVKKRNRGTRVIGFRAPVVWTSNSDASGTKSGQLAGNSALMPGFTPPPAPAPAAPIPPAAPLPSGSASQNAQRNKL